MSVSTRAANDAGWSTQLRNPLRVFISAEPWLALAFMIISFVLGVAWFVIIVTLLSVGLGLAITFIGIPLVVATLLLCMYGAKLERARIGAFLRTPIRDPYVPLPEGSWWPRLKVRLKDKHLWLDLLYLLLLFPLGIAEFIIATVGITVPFAIMSLPAYYWIGDHPTVFAIRIDTFQKAWLMAPVGLPLLLLLPYVLVGVGRGHGWFARQILGTNREAELSERVDQLTTRRSQALDSSLGDLRRIERDLHDGAQQRLVKLSMDLGMAREKLDTDLDRAKQLIEEAHEESKLAMAEIRDLARGILPAVLTDRGLGAAITALAGRSPVPITVENNVEGRLPERVESAAYFIVAEALTNMARYSHATQGSISIALSDETLEIRIEDNGVGGADAARGSGLSGMQNRASAIDGTVTIDSPIGGPTRIRAELPCESS